MAPRRDTCIHRARARRKQLYCTQDCYKCRVQDALFLSLNREEMGVPIRVVRSQFVISMMHSCVLNVTSDDSLVYTFRSDRSFALHAYGWKILRKLGRDISIDATALGNGMYRS